MIIIVLFTTFIIHFHPRSTIARILLLFIDHTQNGTQ